jgi:drug/metabolite transporter (DMT)-like permease
VQKFSLTLSPHSKALFAIHGAVLLFALSGLFGKWLTIPAVMIALGRAFFAAWTLALVMLLMRQSFRLKKRQDFLPIATTGVVLATHWCCFFLAIQLTNVTLGMLTVATYPIFVSLMEPLYFKEKLQTSALLQALATALGIYVVLPDFSLNQQDFYGVLIGVFAAFCFAVLTLLNRRYVRHYSAIQVSFYQNSFAAITLLPLLFFFPVDLSGSQLPILIILAVVFTAFAHTVFTQSLKTIKAHTASIIVSLEPLYGILAAMVLLSERLTQEIILGGSIILLTNIWAIKTSKPHEQ